MKVFLYCIFAAVGGLLIRCDEDDEKTSACNNFATTTLDFKGRDLNVVRSNIKGRWKVTAVEGGCCMQSLPGPPNTYLIFMDSDIFVSLSADTLAAGGVIRWKKSAAWADHWMIENTGEVIISLDSGHLITSTSPSPWEAFHSRWTRECE